MTFVFSAYKGNTLENKQSKGFWQKVLIRNYR